MRPSSFLRLFAILAFATAANSGWATTYLVYFDVSSSAKQFHQSYVQDFAKFADRNLNFGDKVILQGLGLETQNFEPFFSSTMSAPSGGVSEKKKKEALEAARGDVIAAAPPFLKKPVKVDATNILGALVSAADYFQQNKVAAADRVLVLFTDGIEQSAMNKVNMEKLIPKTVPQNVKLPSNLSARIYMIGIYPPNKSGAQETLRNFWLDAAAKTSSSMEKYIMRYE